MTETQASQQTASSEHKELYDYINKLLLADIIELLNIVFYQEEINMDGKLKDSDKFRNLFIDTLFKALLSREYEEDDNVIINNIKLALEGLHNDELSYHDLNYDFSIKTNNERLNELSQFDNLWLLLTRYNVIPNNNIFLDDLEDDIKEHTIIKVIENKIKYKYVVERIKEYYDKELSEYKDDKFIMGELAKKFNLNFRIHTVNDKANKEELQRKDNDGWIIKCKPSQTKFEVAKLGNHYFNYERLFIPRNLLNDNNKLFAYFMVVGSLNIDKLFSDDTIKQFIKSKPPNADLLTTANNDKTITVNHNLLSQNSKQEDKASESKLTDKPANETHEVIPEIINSNSKLEMTSLNNSPELTNILNSIYKLANEQNENQRTQYERLTKTLNDSIQAKSQAEQEQINKFNNVIATIEKTFSAGTFDSIIEHIDNMVSQFVSNQEAKNNEFNNKFEYIDNDINELLDRTKQQQEAIDSLDDNSMRSIEQSENENINELNITIDELNDKIQEQEDTISKLKIGYDKLFKQHADLINKLSLAVYNIDEGIYNHIFNKQAQDDKTTTDDQ